MWGVGVGTRPKGESGNAGPIVPCGAKVREGSEGEGAQQGKVWGNGEVGVSGPKGEQGNAGPIGPSAVVTR